MTIRYAESRLPPPPKDRDRNAVRAFWRGAAIFSLLGFICGWLV